MDTMNRVSDIRCEMSDFYLGIDTLDKSIVLFINKIFISIKFSDIDNDKIDESLVYPRIIYTMCQNKSVLNVTYNDKVKRSSFHIFSNV